MSTIGPPPDWAQALAQYSGSVGAGLGTATGALTRQNLMAAQLSQEDMAAQAMKTTMFDEPTLEQKPTIYYRVNEPRKAILDYDTKEPLDFLRIRVARWLNGSA